MRKSVNSSGNEKRSIAAGNVTESAAKKKTDVNVIWKGVVGLKKRASRKCAKNFVENEKKLKGKRRN